MLKNPYNLPNAKQASNALKAAWEALGKRLDAKHTQEIDRLRKAITEVKDFQGTIGKL